MNRDIPPPPLNFDNHKVIPFDTKDIRRPMPFPDKQIDIFSLFLFLMVVALSLAYRFIHEWQSAEKRVLRAETEKVNAELSFLKAQINPHFLFNTLNNIYSLAVTGSKNTPDSIMKLSNIMHFITDEAGSDYISLNKEIDFIRDYIDMQKLRLSQNTKVVFEVEGKIDNKEISPLIFMPFIENTFKYGISKSQQSEIIIKILIGENSISFRSLNSIFRSSIISERVGIGISNAKKRLEYFYPNTHRLDIRETDNLFIVNLTIEY